MVMKGADRQDIAALHEGVAALKAKEELTPAETKQLRQLQAALNALLVKHGLPIPEEPKPTVVDETTKPKQTTYERIKTAIPFTVSKPPKESEA